MIPHPFNRWQYQQKENVRLKKIIEEYSQKEIMIEEEKTKTQSTRFQIDTLQQ